MNDYDFEDDFDDEEKITPKNNKFFEMPRHDNGRGKREEPVDLIIEPQILEAIISQIQDCCKSSKHSQYAKENMYCIHRDYQSLVMTMKNIKGDAKGADKLFLAAMALAASSTKFVSDIHFAVQKKIEADVSGFSEEDLDSSLED